MRHILTLLTAVFMLLWAQALVAQSGSVPNRERKAPEAVHTVFDGIYLISVSRVWRDDYWRDKQNPHYSEGQTNLIQAATVEIKNGEVLFLELVENNAAAGPAFEDFEGRLSEGGTLYFRTKVNKLLGEGKHAPFTLMASVQLSAAQQIGSIVTVEPRGFDEGFAAHVAVETLAIFVNAPQMSAIDSGELKELNSEIAELRSENEILRQQLLEVTKELEKNQNDNLGAVSQMEGQAEPGQLGAEQVQDELLAGEREWKLDPDYDDKVATYESGDTTVGFSCFPNYNFLTFTFITKALIPSTDTPQVTFIFDGEAYPWQNSNHGGQTWAGSLEDPYESGHGLHTLRLAFNATNYNAGWWSTLANKFMESDNARIKIQGVEYGSISLNGSARALKNIANLQACQ